MQRKLLLYILAIFATIPYSCHKDESETINTHGISFVIKGKDIMSYRAKIVISHTGTNRDKYCGFVVPGHKIDISSYVRQGRLTQEVIYDQKKREISIGGLSPNNKYTYIVAGVDENDYYTGAYSSFEFTTKNEVISCSLNTDWEVEYRGQTLYESGYYSHIHVSSVSEEQYIFLIFTKQERQRFEHEDAFLVYATEKYESMYSDSQDGSFWEENMRTYSQSMNFYRQLSEGEYIAYAIGVDWDGHPTGQYNKTEYFAETEYPMTEGYKNLLGTWELTDSLDNSFIVNILKDTANRTLTIKGWGSKPNDTFQVTYNQQTTSITFINDQLIDSLITATGNNTTLSGPLYLKAWYMDGNTRKWSTVREVALATRNNNTSYTIQETFYAYNLYGVVKCDKGLSFVMYYENKPYVIVGATMTFPIKMKKM